MSSIKLTPEKPAPWTKGDKIFAEMSLVAVLGAIWVGLSMLMGILDAMNVLNDYRVFYDAAQRPLISDLIYPAPPVWHALHDKPFSYGPYLYAPFYLLPMRIMHHVPVFVAEFIWLGLHTIALAGVLMLPAFRRFAAFLGPKVSADRMVQLCFLLLLPLMLFDQFVGHPTLSSCALLLLGAIWLKPRPFCAGLAWACLTYKFQLVLLVPFALMFWGEKEERNRAIAGFAGGCVLVFCIGLAMLGWQGWLDFFRAIIGHGQIVHHSYLKLGGNLLASPYIALRYRDMPDSIAFGVQAITAIAAIWGVILAARKRNPVAVFLMLATGFPLVTPYVYIYDLAPVAVAVALLGAQASATPPRWGMRLLLVLLAALPFVIIGLNGRQIPPATLPLLAWLASYLWIRRLPAAEAIPA